MGPVTVDAKWLIDFGAFVLSLAFSYIPGLRVWYAGKSSEFKALFMAALLLLLVIVVFAIGCAGWIVVSLACTTQGVVDGITVFFTALAINQGTYVASPQTDDVKRAKELRV